MAGGWLKFTQIRELNDPSELTPVVDRESVRDSLRLLRKKGYTQEQFEWLTRQATLLTALAPENMGWDVPQTVAQANQRLSHPNFYNLDRMEEMQLKTIESIRSGVGVLSLSERYDSLPMWAHYADLARGFVVTFENLDRVFKGDDTGSLNVLKPVAYTDRFTGMTFDPSTQDALFFSKLSDWSYEREWRVVSALEACQRDGALYLRKVDQPYMTGVIYGWNVSSSELMLLREGLNEINQSAKVVPATLRGGVVSCLDPLK